MEARITSCKCKFAILFSLCLTSHSVKVKTYTWTKDSNKLFDYECSNLSQSSIVTANSLIIARKDNQIVFHDPAKGEVPQEHTPLACLKKSSDGNTNSSIFLFFSCESRSQVVFSFLPLICRLL